MRANIKSFIAAIDIPRNSLVKFSDEDNKITLATSGTDLIIGATLEKDVKAGEIVDVILIGFAEVKFGGVVSRGEAFTAGAGGKAVKATDGNIVAGYVLKTVSADEIAPAVLLRA